MDRRHRWYDPRRPLDACLPAAKRTSADGSARTLLEWKTRFELATLALAWKLLRALRAGASMVNEWQERVVLIYVQHDPYDHTPLRVVIGDEITLRADVAGGGRKHGKRAAGSPRPTGRQGIPAHSVGVSASASSRPAGILSNGSNSKPSRARESTNRRAGDSGGGGPGRQKR